MLDHLNLCFAGTKQITDSAFTRESGQVLVFVENLPKELMNLIGDVLHAGSNRTGEQRNIIYIGLFASELIQIFQQLAVKLLTV